MFSHTVENDKDFRILYYHNPRSTQPTTMLPRPSQGPWHFPSYAPGGGTCLHHLLLALTSWGRLQQVQTPPTAQTNPHLAACAVKPAIALSSNNNNKPSARTLHLPDSANMFRRIEETLEKDPSFPTNLKQLG
jgi:hypothetical protein